MKKNEELFYLIKSLNKSEKRYFKLETQRNEHAEYLLLFEAIDKQKSYDEAQIKDLFKDKSFITQLTTIKNYLKQRILQSLRNYHSKISKSAELIDIIRNVEILFHKGQYDLCKSELKRAEKKAIHFENNKLLFHIRDWKRKTHQALDADDTTTIRYILALQKENLQHSQNHIDLLLANTNPEQYNVTYKKGNILQHNTLRSLHKFKKQLDHHTPEKAKETLDQLLKEWESQPELQKEFFSTYLSLVNKFLAVLMLNQHYREAYVRVLRVKPNIQTVQKISATLVQEQLQLYQTELALHSKLKDIHTTHDVIKEIQTFLKSTSSLGSANHWLSFRVRFAAIYFAKQDTNQSLIWIDTILKEDSKNDDKPLVTHAFWMAILIAYQKRERPILKTLIQQLKKHIKAYKNIVSYEKELWQFLSKTIHLQGAPKQKAFVALHQWYTTMQIEESFTTFINFEEWIARQV